jgi:hypothetical protein
MPAAFPTSCSLSARSPRGVFWETMAVPDIRIQCERLAEHEPSVSQDAILDRARFIIDDR